MEFVDLAPYRTKHSIHDRDIKSISTELESIGCNTFLDFGCHFGHLSIYLAVKYGMTIYSVDNFVGSFGDDGMEKTIFELTGTDNFYDKFIENVGEAKNRFGFKGKIIPMVSAEFLKRTDIELDMAFIDSSHRVEDAWEFETIANMVVPGGIIGGHDGNFPGVQAGRELISQMTTEIHGGGTWFVRKV